MLSKFFWAQVGNPSRGDWCLVVQDDLKSLDLGEYDFERIATLSKEGWKKEVKEKCFFMALKQLNSEKKSKLKHLVHNNLKMQEYLTCEEIGIRNKKLLFLLRSRMVKVGDNMTKEQCKLCLASDTQRHLIETCHPLNAASEQLRSNHGMVYEDIFSDEVPKLKNIADLFRIALQTREYLLAEQQ